MHSALEPEFAARLEELLVGAVQDDAPVALRQEAAEALAEAVGRMAPPPAWIDVYRRLVVDEAPEVRRAVAHALTDLPDEAFAPLAARLSDDPNRYVRDTVAKAFERRGQGLQQGRKRRKDVADFQERYLAFEKNFGSRAARQARRMANEMLSVLVGSTLHDMDGILAPMRADLDVIRKHLEDGKPGRASCRTKVGKFQQQLEYLQAFLDDMRTYARAAADKRSRCAVRDIALKALALAREGLQAVGMATDAVVVALEVPETLRASLYTRQATTALMHLIRNGIDTLAEFASAGEKRLTVRACSDGAGGVRIAVEDNGPGIDPVLVRELLVFAPGKTTRKSRGTGFGLPTANRFAEAHGGRLEIDSRPGVGSAFTLLLPAGKEDDE